MANVQELGGYFPICIDNYRMWEIGYHGQYSIDTTEQVYATYGGAHVFCGRACHKAAKHANTIARNIANSTRRRKERRDAARKELPDTICSQCQKPFRPLRKDAKVCSDACRQEAYRDRKKSIKNTQSIWTIGTNGKKFPEFLDILQKADVETVLDVRKSANSTHVPVFSEKSLSVELPNSGIMYIHKKELGVPLGIVKRYTTKKPIDGIEPLTDAEFESYYRENISHIDLDALVKEINGYGKTVLLCACEYALKQKKQKHNCHRSILANILFETGEFKEIINL